MKASRRGEAQVNNILIFFESYRRQKNEKTKNKTNKSGGLAYQFYVKSLRRTTNECG